MSIATVNPHAGEVRHLQHFRQFFFETAAKAEAQIVGAGRDSRAAVNLRTSATNLFKCLGEAFLVAALDQVQLAGGGDFGGCVALY